MYRLLFVLFTLLVVKTLHASDTAWLAPVNAYVNLDQVELTSSLSPVVLQADGNPLSQVLDNTAFIASLNTFSDDSGQIIEFSIDGLTWQQAAYNGSQYQYDFGTLIPDDYILQTKVNGILQPNIAFQVLEYIAPPTDRATVWGPDEAGVEQKFDFEWDEVANATFYKVVVYDGHTNPEQPMQEHDNLVDPSISLSVPIERVVIIRTTACNAGGCGPESGAKIVNVVTDVPDAVDSIVSPSVVAVNQEFSVSWDAVSGANRYRIYQNRTGLSTDGRSRLFSFPEVGEYDFRVAACNDNYCAAPSEKVTVLVTLDGAPPPDAAPDPVLGGGTAPNSSEVGQDFTYEWNASAGATSYKVGLYDGSTSPQELIREIATVTQPVAVISHDTPEFIFLRVVACNAAGCSEAGPGTGAGRIVELQSSGLGIVTAVRAPSQGVAAHDFNVSWGTVDEASSYTVQIVDFDDPDTVLSEFTDIVGTNADVYYLQSGNFRVRVRACKGAGCGGWSYVRTIELSAPSSVPDAVTGGAEAPNRAEINTDFEYSWQRVQGATYYRVGLYDGYDPTVMIEEKATVSVPTATLSHGTPEFIYTLVEACNELGCTGAGPGLGAKRIIELTSSGMGIVTGFNVPTEAYTGVNFGVHWSSVNNADFYTVQIISNEGNETVLSEKTVNGSSNVLAFISHGQAGDYLVRVKACVTAGCGGWSSYRPVTLQSGQNAPTAIADSETYFLGSQASYNVLANDLDPSANGLTLFSVGATSFGEASIVDNKLSFTATMSSCQDIVLDYSMVNSDGLSSSTLTLNCKQVELSKYTAVVGQTIQVNWFIPDAISCTMGETSDVYTSSPSEVRLYQTGTLNWQCTDSSGQQVGPTDVSIDVEKLPAPTNLKSEEK